MGEDEAPAIARGEGGIAITITKLLLLFADVCVMTIIIIIIQCTGEDPHYFHPLCFDVTMMRRKTMKMAVVVE